MMSAYVVSKATIDAIVTAVSRHADLWPSACLDVPPDERANYLGQTLWDENRRSVDHRYRLTPVLVPYQVPPRLAVSPTPVELLKLLRCLEYQSCECPDYRSTRAWEMNADICRAAVRHLPGYDDAPWGLP
jgi:hypothetical protein